MSKFDDILDSAVSKEGRMNVGEEPQMNLSGVIMR